MIPTVITQIANGARQVQLGALTPTRDFSYVQDTVNGFLAVLNSNNGLGQVVNLGSNFEVSIRDTVSLIAESMNATVEITSSKERLRPDNSEVERLWSDNSKAKELFGWQPTYGGRDGFKRGLSETIAWFMHPKNLSSYKSDIYNL